MTRRAHRIAALAALLLALLPATGYAVHPFYENLLAEGLVALGGGDPAEAERTLRLAAFGMLEEPPRLAYTLTHLALAQATLGEAEAFRTTFSRLVEVERRFGAYSAAQVPEAVRADFEARAVDLVPATLLTTHETFRPLADRKAAAELARLDVRERRPALEARLADDPDSSLWPRLLAELELAEGRAKAAAAAARTGLERAPEDPVLHCLRGRALAGEDCGRAMPHLARCPAPETDAEVAQQVLACRIELGQLDEAAALLDRLPAETRERRPIARLGRRLAEGRSRQAATQGEATSARVQSPPAEEVPESPTPTTGRAPLDDGERADLERARRLLAEARTAGELDEAFELARRVADAHPNAQQAQHLAGEIAYRASRFDEAARYYERGGTTPETPAETLFYAAVSFYEAGKRNEARKLLGRALPELLRSPFVDGYVEKILGDREPR